MIYHDSSSPCSIFWTKGYPSDQPGPQVAGGRLETRGGRHHPHGLRPWDPACPWRSTMLHGSPDFGWPNFGAMSMAMTGECKKKWPMNSEFGKKLQLGRGWIIPGIHGIKWHIATFGLDNYDHWADVERTFMSALPPFGQHDSLVLGVCQPAPDQLYYCWIRWFVLIIEQLMVSRLRGGVLTWPSYGADIQTCQDAKPDVRFLIKNRPKWCGKDM